MGKIVKTGEPALGECRLQNANGSFNYLGIFLAVITAVR